MIVRDITKFLGRPARLRGVLAARGKPVAGRRLDGRCDFSLQDLILMGEMRWIVKAIGDAMREGGKSEVEILPEKGKKTKATPSE